MLSTVHIVSVCDEWCWFMYCTRRCTLNAARVNQVEFCLATWQMLGRQRFGLCSYCWRSMPICRLWGIQSECILCIVAYAMHAYSIAVTVQVLLAIYLFILVLCERARNSVETTNILFVSRLPGVLVYHGVWTHHIQQPQRHTKTHTHTQSAADATPRA